MKMWVGVLTVLSLLIGADVASASCRTRCAPTCCPTTCYAPSCGTSCGTSCAPSPSCGYTYVTTYVDVSRTVCETVPVTVMQDPRRIEKPFVLKTAMTERGQCAAVVVRREG